VLIGVGGEQGDGLAGSPGAGSGSTLGGKLYHLRAEGFGTDADEARSPTIVAGAASLEVELPLTRGFFLLELGARF
jgi:hypothetical protein